MTNTVFYRCEKCGNMVTVVNNGGGTLTCCGQAMTKLEANSTNAAPEKHVPVISKENGKIQVTVGSVLHPMTAEHFIEWIALVTDEKVDIVYLKPGMEPKAEFLYNAEQEEEIYTGVDDEIVPNCEGQPCNFVYEDAVAKKTTAYAYCNLHGLWKSEL